MPVKRGFNVVSQAFFIIPYLLYICNILARDRKIYINISLTTY